MAPKIMVIDDSELVLKAVDARLRAQGFEVITRTEALGSSAAILTERPDLVLLDVKMPGLDGLSLARLIGVNPATARVRIVLHTSQPAETLAGLVKQCGAAGAIHKGSSATTFIEEIRRLLALPPRA
jgi:DNA-binding NarL/FixJ family response regulator